MHDVTAIILAAGKGERLGGRKPLARIGEKTLLQRVAGTFAAAGVEHLLVVTGAFGDEVGAHAHSLGMQVAHNTHFHEGMFSSVCTGVRAVMEAGAALLHPVDTPLLRATTISAVLEAWRATPHPELLLLPCHGGLPGHPPLLGRYHMRAVPQWHGEHGLCGYIDQAAGVRRIAVEDPGIIMDIDTPGDLQNAQTTLERRIRAEKGSHVHTVA